MHQALNIELEKLGDKELLELLDEVSTELKRRNGLMIFSPDHVSVDEKLREFLKSIGITDQS